VELALLDLKGKGDQPDRMKSSSFAGMHVSWMSESIGNRPVAGRFLPKLISLPE
jgi:hypothetical protein